MRADDHRERSPVSRTIRLSRRRFGIIAVGLAAPLFVSRAQAEGVPVPVVLQAELLAKVLEYDRNFPARASDRTRVLLVQPCPPMESPGRAGHASARCPAFARYAHEIHRAPGAPQSPG